MSDIVEINLPIAPSVNGLFRNVKGRGRVRTEKYQTWANAAGWELKDQRPGFIAGRFKSTIAFGRYPDKRHRDIDNRVKAVWDLLKEHGVIEDDYLLEDLRIYWTDEVLPGRCAVQIGRAA